MRVRLALLGGLILLLALAAAALLLRRPPAEAREGGPIVIGVLHALSGPMATSEAPLVQAVRLAVDEINGGGGLLGRRVVLGVEDTRADPAVAAAAATRLIREQHAVALFGCWTSLCRQAVRPVVEARRHLLFYPMAYEGMEQSPHIVYTGPTPNQQVLPATDWAMQTFGRRVYLVGTDGPFPRRVNAMLRDFVRLGGGEVVGERYVRLGATDVAEVTAELQAQRPAVVLSTLSGDSNGAFFDALAAGPLVGLPLLSFAAAEPDMRAYGGGRLARHYTAWGYLQSLPGSANADFLARLRRAHGAAAQASDPAVSAYVGVHLWAAAVRELGGTQTEAVNANVLQQGVAAPHGHVEVDVQTRHVRRPLRIAQVQPDGQLREVWQLPRPVKPAPWPAFRSRAHWAAIVAAPGATP